MRIFGIYNQRASWRIEVSRHKVNKYELIKTLRCCAYTTDVSKQSETFVPEFELERRCFTTLGELLKLIFPVSYFRWKNQHSPYWSYVVLGTRWRLRITDAETAPNFYHKFCYRFITLTLEWVLWRLRSPASRLFIQPFVQAQIKENIKAPRQWPLCGEFTYDQWIPRTNGQ